MFLADIFVRVILPVFVVVALGYVYARVTSVDVKPFARLAWNVTGPCLGFAALATTTLPDDDFARIFFFIVVLTVALWPLAVGAAKWLGLDRATSSSFQLSVLFGNCVNYGFPVLLFAFGQAAVDRGVVIMAGNQVLLSTLAVFIAARGRLDLKQSLRQMTRVPLLWGSIAGFVVNRAGIVIPKPIFDPIQMVGTANLMLMLLILGMQLAQVTLSGERKAVGVAVGMRLLLSAGMGAGLALVMGMQGLTMQASIVEAGVPTAVYAAIVAAEFDVAPGFAAASILVSTIASMGTLTLILALLGVR
jgi:malate permease and related proteins